MCMAAEKSIATPQFEILLKVKQSNNQDFGFLCQGDALNPLYLFLKQRQQQQRGQTFTSADDPTKHNVEESRLLVDYDSSSSDEEVSGIDHAKESGHSSPTSYSFREADGPALIKAEVGGTCTVVEEKNSLSDGELSTKARRLKRARLLKGHFSLKMMDNINKK